MIRVALASICLSGCISDGYVLRSASVDAEPGRVGFTVTFDNIHLPELGGNCLEVCVVE